MFEKGTRWVGRAAGSPRGCGETPSGGTSTCRLPVEAGAPSSSAPERCCGRGASEPTEGSGRASEETGRISSDGPASGSGGEGGGEGGIATREESLERLASCRLLSDSDSSGSVACRGVDATAVDVMPCFRALCGALGGGDDGACDGGTLGELAAEEGTLAGKDGESQDWSSPCISVVPTAAPRRLPSGGVAPRRLLSDGVAPRRPPSGGVATRDERHGEASASEGSDASSGCLLVSTVILSSCWTGAGGSSTKP